ncbi:unnamed protein product [Orchesella dallaii]|uniref:Uncharacterized protein n=1 Tax=Orchesella dallaii TaxID=48710 RepID=A0ABP1PWE7_9HEXA
MKKLSRADVTLANSKQNIKKPHRNQQRNSDPFENVPFGKISHTHLWDRSQYWAHSNLRDRSHLWDRSQLWDASHLRDRSHLWDRSQLWDPSQFWVHCHFRDPTHLWDHSHLRDRSHYWNPSPLRYHSQLFGCRAIQTGQKRKYCGTQ